jgi:atypical dual specificity phosphatase
LAKGEVIMVHCEAGISRSASMVIAYLIKYKKLALVDAYALVKSKRKQICPNHGFFSLLLKWEKANTGSNSCTFEYGLCQFLREIVPNITEEKVRQSL